MLPYVLMIEDDEDISEFVKSQLVLNNFTVKTTATGTAGLALFKKSEPDLILLDLKLPDIAGETICKQIKESDSRIPVIMLTASDSLADKVGNLNTGADDYITKPFEMSELIARIRARLREKLPNTALLKVGDLTLDPQKIEVKRGEKQIILTPQEFKLLEYLMQNAGQILSRDAILNRIWLLSPDVESRVVDVYIGYLRKKIDLGFKKKLIASVRGFGYTIRE